MSGDQVGTVEALSGAAAVVSVVICTHRLDRREMAEKAIHSVLEQTLSPREVIVVVDGDRDLELALQTAALPVTLLRLDQRSGLSAARNAGIERVSAPLVAFLDDDAVADPDWLERLVDDFVDEDVLGVGGWSEPRWQGRRPLWFPRELLWAVGCSYEGLPDTKTPVRNVLGGCACYRRSLFQQVGGFRSDLGRKATGAGGAEETELCLRARSAMPHGRFMFDPKARIHHWVPPSRLALTYLLRRSWREGRAKALIAALHGVAVLEDEFRYVRKVSAALPRNVFELPRHPARTLAHAFILLMSMGAAALGFATGRPLYWRKRPNISADGGRALRVAQVCAHYSPHAGGIETHVRELSVRLHSKGWRVTTVTSDPSRALPASDCLDGVEIRRHPAWPKNRDWCFAPGVLTDVALGRYDLVHCQGVHTLVGPMAMVAAWAARTPYAVTFHTGGHSSDTRNRLRRLQWRLLRPLLRRADALVAVCESEIELFGRSLGLPPERFTLIRNGSEPPGTGIVPGRKRHTSGDLLILSVGRLERYKGHQRAIAAMVPLVERRPARLIIVGTGPYESALRSQVSEAGLEKHVEFRYFPPNERQGLAMLLQMADAVVLLSDYEAHPVSVMEALALRCPVLVAQTSGLAELARAGWVRSVPVDATPSQVADAIELTAGSSVADLDLPTWDDSAGSVITLYDQMLEASCAS